MVARLFFLSICLPFLLTSCQQSKKTVEFVDYVNPLMGTESTFAFSHGNTYPAVAVPWGMNFWSPQTGENGSGWMYTYADSLMRGFRQTHQPSPWMNDYGTFSIMPLAGELKMSHKERLVPFSHQQEKATPYNYSVTFDNGLQTSLSATSRGAVFEVSFPEKEDQYVVVDAYHGGSSITIEPENRLVKGATRYNNGGVPDNFANYFMMEFSHPVIEYGTYNGDTLLHHQTDVAADYTCAYLKFDVPAGEKLTIRTASSFISPEQAAINFNREVADADVQLISGKAREQWNNYLGRVEAEGGTDEQFRTFYSCLYRTLLFPREFYEFDSQGNPVYYSPYDGNVHDGYMYTDNGFWDTFRSQFPLTNILHPTLQGRYMNALLAAQEQCGWLPSWSSPGETGGMLGNHSISLLADAWAKGIRDFDPEKALEAYAHEAMNKGPWGGANGRGFWKEYFQLGYVPYPQSMGSSAQTMEYAYDDFCGYQLAKMIGNKHYQEVFARQMYNYRNVFDKSIGFMRGKGVDGKWQEPFDPLEWGGPFCEGNAWHYTWSVFHDVQGLIDLFGDDEKFTTKIDSVFSLPGTIKPGTYGGIIHEMKEMELANMGQYAHGNQPIQHMPYLYCYAGQPWKTQYWVRQIVERLYNSTEKGYPGDEDQGGMSSWYILSSLGIYAVCPGTDEYVIGSPLFKKATITLENGNKFVIEAPENSKENLYIQSATLNGRLLDKNFIRYNDISDGGVLKFEMGSQPNKERCTTKYAAPFSLSKKDK